MKKYILYFISIFTILMLPFSVSAANVSVSVECGTINVGEETTCSVYATNDGGLSAAKGDISITGGAVQYVSAAAGDLQGNFSNSGFQLYGSPKTGRVKLGTVTVRGVSGGTATVSATVTFITDNNFTDASVNAKGSGKVTVNAPTTTTTAKPTQRATQAQTQIRATTEAPVTETTRPNKLYLTGITVDEYEVKEENGVYTVTVDGTREYVEIKATAPEGVSIAGTGKRNLAYGRNNVSLVLRDEFGGTATVSVIITRPDGSDANTLLKTLDVVNYDLKFDPNTMEYTVTVPYNIKEVYVYAVAQSPDTIVTGDGIATLNDQETNVYVKVAYGDQASSTYKVTIKKSYMSLVPMILLGIGLFGALGGMIYFALALKKSNQVIVNNEVAVKAEEERNEEAAGPQMSLNGASTTGVGARIVEPTVVEHVVSEPNLTPRTDLVDEPFEIGPTPEVQTKVVNTRPNTNPGMVPPKVVPVNNLSVGNSPQVKVVKKVTQPVHPTVVKKVVVNQANNQ